MVVLFFGKIWSGIYAERRKRKNQHLSEFESAVRSEIRNLNERADNVDRPLMEWHIDSIRRLDPYANYMKDFDKKRWNKIKGSYDDYLPPSYDWDTYLGHYIGKKGFPREFLGNKLNNLLHSIVTS